MKIVSFTWIHRKRWRARIVVERSVLFPMQMFGIKPTVEEYAGKRDRWKRNGQPASPRMARKLRKEWERRQAHAISQNR